MAVKQSPVVELEHPAPGVEGPVLGVEVGDWVRLKSHPKSGPYLVCAIGREGEVRLNGIEFGLDGDAVEVVRKNNRPPTSPG